MMQFAAKEFAKGWFISLLTAAAVLVLLALIISACRAWT
jgi:uncharacterized protein YhdP